ncbi:endonuclease V [Candidatus Protochlamydia naegleriophila]|uniref:Endonuclease V n=1 Tax=Candidatus Protochlamydia naegleriophila TaxID=389348 RepID=A0A0U5JAJ2_9BACT|nr:deoxyribonuclease V [Candidatus Protochlamydia naegleriophila]CUI17049.1 endonuclease V [Candidatus Protochlamydia naegleriophila]
MQVPSNWLYPDSLEEAKKVQNELASRVLLQDDFNPLRLLGGMDVSNNPYDPKKMVYAAVVTLDVKSLTLESKAHAAKQQPFPYIPGFLGFRESPPLIEAFQKLPKCPDLFLVDGQGISHPRRLGIASHIGVLLDIPTIGVAKNILVGKPQGELGESIGDYIPLIANGEEVGVLLRTKSKCNPLIISPGHRISLKTAIEIVLACMANYRLPEPTRHAHLTANECRKNYSLS